MASDREKISNLIEEIKKYGEQFDPERLATLPRVWEDSPNIDLVQNLLNDCALGNIICEPAQPGLRPLEKVLDDLRREFTKDFV